MSPVIESLRKMGLSLDGELRSLLAFFGESPESPDAPKPEEFFGLILSFSSALQKAALEVHDAMAKSEPPSPKIMVEETAASPTAEEGVRMPSLFYCAILTWSQTVKGKDKDGDTLRPQTKSQSRATGLSVGRGDLDQAIRSMRTGRRRDRNLASRPLSKIFVDGARTSRIYDP